MKRKFDFKQLTNFWWVLLIAALIPSFSRLIHKGFIPTQDYIYVARIYEMDKSLKDGQFPVRWVPDFRYGEPLFNFYAPLPYYIGSLVHTFNISFLNSAKVLYVLGYILSFFSMYFLGRQLWGKRGGIVSAFVYLYAPYRALDVFVRGDLSESWVFVFFPLIFLAALKLSKKISGKNIAFLSLSLAGLFYTHNLMTMLIAPFFIIWIIYLAWREKKFSIFYALVGSSLLGLTLSASFMIPSFFEKSFIQTQHLTDGYFNFRAHFIELRQFFSTFWGYGASTWLGEDGMSFQLGTVQWITLGFVLLLGLIKKKQIIKDKSIYLIGIIFLLFLFSLFLQHNKSTFIWVAIPILQYVQFPWRFMAISVFFASMLVGVVAKLIPKVGKVVIAIFIILLIFVNYNFFKPESYYQDSTDADYISKETLLKDDRLPKDYLPIWVKKISSTKIVQPVIISGQGQILNYKSRSESATFNLETTEESVIEVPITYFPGWTVKLNGVDTILDNPTDFGLIRFHAPKGEFKVVIHFGNTPLRTIGNILSSISFCIVLYLIFYKKSLNWTKK